MYFRRKTSGGRAYLQIVESKRQGDQVRQQVIATLGRYEDLKTSGQLERLLRSGARFAQKAMVLSAVDDDTAAKIDSRRIGPALVFERLWQQSGCRAVIEELAGDRKHGFAVERAVFLTVLHRLFGGGSDRAADRWREDYAILGIKELDLHHLYRAMAWLGEELPSREQDGRTPFAPRCMKDLLEESLFYHRRDLLTRLDLVFIALSDQVKRFLRFLSSFIHISPTAAGSQLPSWSGKPSVSGQEWARLSQRGYHLRLPLVPDASESPARQWFGRRRRRTSAESKRYRTCAVRHA